MNVRVDLNYPIYDGAEIVFKAPCGAADVTGLIVYYPGEAGTESMVFAFADAHTNDLGDLDELFAEGAVVKVILDTETSMAFVQNAATNAYLESRFAQMGGGGGSLLYTSLSSAIADINNGTTANVTNNNAKVEVFTTENGEKIVRLLADVSESAQIDIATDMTIVLNGHTLNLTTAAAYLNFTAGTNCTINGEVKGSAIKKENVSSTVQLYLLMCKGNSLIVRGGYYSIVSNENVSFAAFYADPVCNVFEVYDADMYVKNTLQSTTKTARCINSKAKRNLLSNTTAKAETCGSATVAQFLIDGDAFADCVITDSSISAEAANKNAISCMFGGCNSTILNCDITAKSDVSVSTSYFAAVSVDKPANIEIKDSRIYGDGYKGHTIFGAANSVIAIHNSTVFADALSGHAEKSYASAIQSVGTLICIDTDVTGTYAAVDSHGDLYVKGGTFSGYTHGAFYLIHEAENKAYINNAVMRFGVYEGSHADFSANALAGFYIGLDSFTSQGISVYMDGCTIEGKGGEPFVVRAGAAGKTNTLYVSNTTNNATASLPIRLNAEQTTNRAEMKIGMGCNFTPASTSDPQWAEETGKLYRRMKDDMPMDGRDFNALMTMQ